jgi:putative acetyltransferase
VSWDVASPRHRGPGAQEGSIGIVEVRLERPEDIPGIRAVQNRAFGRPEECAVVDRLRAVCEGLVSLVAVDEGQVVGHVLFSPAWIETGGGREVPGMGLAPLAVLPECQRQGIGTELTKAGLAAIRQTPCPFVIVLGHPGYYPRFGFEPASRRGIRCRWEVPDEAFMVLVLDEEAMRGVAGLAHYRPEWDAAT